MTEADVICLGCDFVLDTGFLGDGITDQSDGHAPAPPNVDDHSMFGEDAVILGSGVEGEFESFEAEDTGFVPREVTNARIYVGGKTQALLAPDAIPGLVEGMIIEEMKISPYEEHVLRFVNGRRPVGRIRRKCGMEQPELKLALAMMADKGIIHLVGVVDEERKARARKRRRDKLELARAEKRERAKAKKKKRRKKRSATKRDGADKKPSGKNLTQTSREAPSIDPPSTGAAGGKAPLSAETRVEALPASLLEALRSEGASPSPSASALEGEKKAKRKRPRLPPRMRRSLEGQPPLSEVSGLAEVSEPGVAQPKAPIIGGVEATAVRHAPIADADEAANVFSSAAEQALANDSAHDADAFLEDASTHLLAAASDDDQKQDSALDAGLPDEDLLQSPDALATAPSPRSADPAHQDEAAGFDDDNPTQAIDAQGFSIDMPSIEVVEDEGGFAGVGAPPPLPSDHSMLSRAPEDAFLDDASPGKAQPAQAALEAEAELYDLPTGPMAALKAQPGVDDSLVPTGDGPGVPVFEVPPAGAPKGVPQAAEPAGALADLAEDGDGEEGTHEFEFAEADDVVSLSQADAPAVADFLSLPSGAIGPLADPGPGPGPAPLPPSASDPSLYLSISEDDDDHDDHDDHDHDHDHDHDDDDDDDDDSDDIERLEAANPSAAPEPADLASTLAEPSLVPASSPEEEDAEALADDSDEGEPVEVSFEMRRKADKIFEQAEEDAAKGNFGSARMNAKLAMIYDPSNRQFKAKLKEWTAAAEAMPKPSSKSRQDVQLFEEARLAESRGQYEKACRLLKRAVDLNPRAAPVLNLLGVIQATRLKEYKAAGDALLRACDLQPQNLSFKNNLGKVLGMQESARDKSKIDRDNNDGMVKVRKIRPKSF